MDRLVGNLRDKQALAKLVGSASAFIEAIKNLPAISKSDVSVVVTGDTGTGKELVARAIHYLSDRAAYPFVPLNCGSFPEGLMEVELFGHERGAFTDAHAHRKGLLEQAESGTLFLDEVDTLPLKAQVDLLRFLQDRSYRVVGSSEERRANVRIVSASNAPLLHLANSGQFRLDLYYRLCIFTVHLPPLRERLEDIPLLAMHFLEKHTPQGRPVPVLSAEALGDLLLREWTGNVRELENAILRGIHLSQSDVIQIGDLSLPPRGVSVSPVSAVGAKLQDFRVMKRAAIECFEKGYLTRLMAEHHGNISMAALSSGKERRDLGRLLKKYNLNSKEFHTPGSPNQRAKQSKPSFG
jgi:DNA-binding NtrC family response regulator